MNKYNILAGGTFLLILVSFLLIYQTDLAFFALTKDTGNYEVDSKIQDVAANILESNSNKSFQLVIKNLDSKDPKKANIALSLFEKLTESGKQIPPQEIIRIFEQSENIDTKCRIAAIVPGTPEFQKYLVSKLNNKNLDQELKFIIVAKCYDYPDPVVKKTINDMLDSNNTFIKLRILGSFYFKKTTPEINIKIRRLIKDPDSNVRATALTIYAEKSSEFIPEYEEALKDRDTQVLYSVLRVIKEKEFTQAASQLKLMIKNTKDTDLKKDAEETLKILENAIKVREKDKK
ncbi:MAG: HEAT repeat domain-containing protein [Firmicutes bacterium]|nr:HEAT repeat domain-containing protein [Bacillota bacterium]